MVDPDVVIRAFDTEAIFIPCINMVNLEVTDNHVVGIAQPDF
jgi:hypothetical protein